MMTEEFARLLGQEAEKIHIHLTENQKEQFFRFYELLLEWNQVMNLTAITEEKEVIVKHFIDSLSLIKVLEAENRDPQSGFSLIDVGTGAGFPGLPLKIAFPQFKVTLLDSLNKRIKFLEQVCQELNLQEIQCIHGRAEDFGKDSQYREQYDFCVSRAVANLASLSEYCIPFAIVGGYFIPYKSGDVEEEIQAGAKAVAILGGTIKQVEKFTLPMGAGDRSLVVIQKTKSTAKKYPRKAGLPSREPLK